MPDDVMDNAQTQDMQQDTQPDTQPDTSLLGDVSQEPQPQQVDWFQMLGEYANDPSIQKFKDPKDLAKSYLEAQKLIGREKIPVPKSDEELMDALKKLGVPDDPTAYPDFDDAAQVFGSKEDFDEFKKVALEAGLLPQQFEALYGKVKEIIQQEDSLTAQERQQVAQQALQQLQQEFGEETQLRLKMAQRVFQELPQETQQKIVQSGLDVDPNFIKFLAKIGEYYKEDSFVVSNYSPAEAKSELQEILNNPKHPYFDRTHPEHDAAVEKVEKLYRVIYGGR